MYVCILGIYLGAEFVGHTAGQFPKVAVTITPPTVHKSSMYSTALSWLCIESFKICSHFGGCIAVYHCLVNFHFPDD